MVRFQPQARTYLTYLMAVVPIYTALLMIGLLTIAGGIMEATRPGFQLPPPRPSVLLAPPIFLIFLTFPMLLVHLCVTLFAQPKFLVARAYRSQAGSIARWRDAKARSTRRREQ